jgi:translation initiation factor IF-3
MIRIPQVRVVDEEGAQLGVMPTPRALEMAQERGLDLVEVAPMASPPVVKFLDFGQYKYDLTKREKEAKRKQRSVTFKEVRLSPKIGTGDFDTKVHRAIEFLEDGDRIKVTVRFRGRELTHPELGRGLLAKFVDRVKEHGVPERTPLLEGKSMHITMASLHKPKSHEAPARTHDEREDGEAATRPAAAPAATNGATAPAAAPATAPPARPPVAPTPAAAAPVGAAPAGPASTPRASSPAAAPVEAGAAPAAVATPAPRPTSTRQPAPVRQPAPTGE